MKGKAMVMATMGKVITSRAKVGARVTTTKQQPVLVPVPVPVQPQRHRIVSPVCPNFIDKIVKLLPGMMIINRPENKGKYWNYRGSNSG